jgi:hypothetical protein
MARRAKELGYDLVRTPEEALAGVYGGLMFKSP